MTPHGHFYAFKWSLFARENRADVIKTANQRAIPKQRHDTILLQWIIAWLYGVLFWVGIGNLTVKLIWG